MWPTIIIYAINVVSFYCSAKIISGEITDICLNIPFKTTDSQLRDFFLDLVRGKIRNNKKG